MRTQEPIAKGRVTLPVEAGLGDNNKVLSERWGADAIRNSDGTELPTKIEEMNIDVYSTLSLTRADQQWARTHRDQLPQKYLITDPLTAFKHALEVDLMEKHFKEQFEIDTIHNSHDWWEVIDRTTGEIVDNSSWEFDPEMGKVRISNAKLFHVYTVTFLVFSIWDPTSMYNHITNNWTGEHIISVDPRHPETRQHILSFLESWMEDNPRTDVVRLTSLIYHFTNNFDNNLRSRYRDWIGYHDCVSPLALKEFEKVKGYRLRPEDIVDKGYLNDVNRVPSQRYLDWIDYNHKSVTEMGKEWVDIIHKAKRKAMLFFCDHWIGTEPYGPYFKKMGFDSIVTPCMSGVESRRITDIPADIVKELRLYPYFFPVDLEGKPSFKEGGNPVIQCRRNWIKIRRAVIQNLPDRIGFGGYLSLVVKFPDFIDYVEKLCNEFRLIHEHTKRTSPYKLPFKVGILNSWGKIRSWIDAEINNWTKPYKGGVLECLSGINVDIEFLNFENIENNGIPEDVGVLINMGDAETAWSGGWHWKNEKIVTIIRDWVYNKAGGFIGIGDPTAYQHQGQFFQLFDVLGVDRERGYSISAVKPIVDITKNHFIMKDQTEPLSLGYKKDKVYACSDTVRILSQEKENIYMSVNNYGKGRSAYMASLEFSLENTRLLLRTLCWVAGKKDSIKRWFTSNPKIECSAFYETGNFVLLNNAAELQETILYDHQGQTKNVKLKPYESRWFKMKTLKEL